MVCMVRPHCAQPIWSLSLAFKKKKKQRQLLRDTDFPPLSILRRRSLQCNGAERHRVEELIWPTSTQLLHQQPCRSLEHMKVINTWKGFLASPQAYMTELSAAAGPGWVQLPRATSPLWGSPPPGLPAPRGLQLIPDSHQAVQVQHFFNLNIFSGGFNRWASGAEWAGGAVPRTGLWS